MDSCRICEKPILDYKKRLCKKHSCPENIFTVENKLVRKKYIKLTENGYKLSPDYYRDREANKKFCQICQKDSNCAIQQFGANEYICAKHINKKNYYIFHGKKYRGDMINVDNGMIYERLCSMHDKPANIISICVDLSSDNLVCEECITTYDITHKCDSCQRVARSYRLLKTEEGDRCCYECIKPERNYILSNGITSLGSNIYKISGVGKGYSLYFQVRGYENKCEHCQRYYEKCISVVEWCEGPGWCDRIEKKYCPHCNYSV